MSDEKPLSKESVEKAIGKTKKLAEAKEDKALITVKEAKNVVEVWRNFLDNDRISDFNLMPVWQKMAPFQKTPTKYIQHRSIGSMSVPYVDHRYAEKALNFVFGFHVSCEIIKTELFAETAANVPVKQQDGTFQPSSIKCWVAVVRVKFTFGKGEDKIVREVVSSHRMYKNAATTQGDATKSALSKAWTVAARTFGIGTDLDAEQRKAYTKVEEATVEVKASAEDQKADFNPGF